ncbi:MAG TPA: type VI secretion system tip protein TssI/VgrG [Polyangium sp.]|nr:type VI secretion system tip protein TssI/VgrG [Polyangium sp.]
MNRCDLSIDGIDERLHVRHFHIHEALSTNFVCSVVVRAVAPDIDIDAHIWASAVFSLQAGLTHVEGGGARQWAGVVEAIRQIDVEPSGLSTYDIRIVSRLFLLTQSHNYRIFQRKTIPEIIETLLEEWHVERKLRLCRDSFPTLACRTQYGESDFSFILRLCEESGITFYHIPDPYFGSIILFTDDPSANASRAGAPLPFEAAPNESAEAEFVTRVALHRTRSPRRIIVRDMDPRRPYFPLHGKADPSTAILARGYDYHYAVGAMKVDGAAAPNSGRYDPKMGNSLAERMLLAEAVHARQASFETNAYDIAPGNVITIANHPHPLLDPTSRALLVTETTIEGDHDKEWRMSCQAVWTDVPYKPRQTTPRPMVHGLQSAIIVGPKDRAIHTDAQGRVKVRFFWDDRAHERADDEHASAWIRVAQTWAGAGFGVHTIPRIGQEVLVGFLGNNPDEPIIVGQVPNALTPPPYPLPQHDTKTVIRTQSTPNGDGFNEISFEDQKGKELLYMRAERDHETHVRNEARELVDGIRRQLVRNDEHNAVGGDRRVHVHGNEHETIDGATRIAIGGPTSLQTNDDIDVGINGSLSLNIAGNLHVRVGGAIVLEGKDATLAGAGGAFFRASGGLAMASTFLENAGAPGIGGPSDPDEPEPPILPASFRAPMPKKIVRLPVLGWIGSGAVPPTGTMTDDAVLCRFICDCDAAKGADGQRRASQVCLTNRLRAYDAALGGKSKMKAEVPYDMTQNPPVPIMSRNEPSRPTTGSPRGSKVPDIIVVKDPSTSPTHDNIERIIEVKFGKDRLSEEQRNRYRQIGGPSAPVEVFTPETCGCGEREKEKERVRVPNEEIMMALIAMMILLLILDDVVGGLGDDVAIPPLVEELAKRLAPLFKPGVVVP